VKPLVVMLTFSETRDEFYAKRKELVQQETARVAAGLGQEVELKVFPEIRFMEEARKQVQEAALLKPDAFILHIPIWAAPHMAVAAARLAELPLLLLGNDRLETSSLVGLLAAAGGMDQCGIKHERVWGDINDAAVRRKIVAFCRAAHARQQLKGSTFGCFGGRSLGIYTAVADANQWQRLFGVDVEHIDQSEIIREAEAMEDGEVQRGLAWLRRWAGRVEEDGHAVTERTLGKQIRSYLALKKIVGDKKLAFIGVKCQTELSDHYCLQCLPVALLNDGFDWDGRQQLTPCSCEADMDGALTMQILRLLAGGAVTNLMDVRHYERSSGIFTFANCGSMAPSFAGTQGGHEDNWSNVHLIPHAFGKAGGAATQFVAAARKLTLARLCRSAGEYWMAIFTGESLARERDELRKTTWSFPHVFVKTELDFEEFFSSFGANHVHAVEGDYVDELISFCRQMDIRYRKY